MMNKRIGACLLSLSMLSVSATSLADCSVSVSDSTVDYGRISRSDVNNLHGDWYGLDERDVRINAFCSEPQNMALFISDGSGLRGFRFGESGNIIITARQAMLDGHAVDLGKTNIHGDFIPMGNKNRRTALVLNNDGLLPVRGGEVATGQQFSLMLHLKPTLKSGHVYSSDEDELLTNLSVQLDVQ